MGSLIGFLTVEPCLHTTAHIVLCWYNWNGILSDVNTRLSTACCDVREMRAHFCRWTVADVQEHMCLIVLQQLVVDGACYYVPRCQLQSLIIAEAQEPFQKKSRQNFHSIKKITQVRCSGSR